MALDTQCLQGVPEIDEVQARIRLFHHLADVTYQVEDRTIREGLYVVGKEGTNPTDKLFFYRQLEELGRGIPKTFDTILLEKISGYKPMTPSKE